jgi:hypothetical protein
MQRCPPAKRDPGPHTPQGRERGVVGAAGGRADPVAGGGHAAPSRVYLARDPGRPGTPGGYDGSERHRPEGWFLRLGSRSDSQRWRGQHPPALRLRFSGGYPPATLSLDATPIVLTPIIYGVVIRLRLGLRLFIFACVYTANTASLFLPVRDRRCRRQGGW